MSRRTVSQTCPICQIVFEATLSEIKRGNGIYCSRKCAGLRRSNIIKKEKETNTFCGYCGIGLYRTESRIRNNNSGIFFCNREHQGLGYSDPNVPVRSGPPRTIKNVKNPCLGCGKQTTKDRCPSCARSFKVLQWLNGNNEITWMGQNHDPHSWVKDYIISMRGDACEVCGFNELHPVYNCSIIQMDHIDGNSLNNDPNNLKLLCPNHHTMTTTYGSRNKNSGRHSRRIANIRASLAS